MIKWVAVLIGAMTMAGSAMASDTFGLWYTEKGKVAVSLAPCTGSTAETPELCGEIIWLKKPHHKSGALKRDANNDDPDLRDKPWCGLTVITGLREKKPGIWTGGTFYYPKDGRRYDIEINERSEGLTVYAFLGIKLLGKKEKWRRVEAELPGCPVS